MPGGFLSRNPPPILLFGNPMDFLRVSMMALIAALPWAAMADEQPLEPDQAFQAEARMEAPGVIGAYWKVADSYYIYRDKLQFNLSPADCKLEKLVLPPGKIKEDEYFGKMAVYREGFPVRIHYSGCEPTDLSVTYQGCGDIGVCFPPVNRKLSLIPTGSAASSFPEDRSATSLASAEPSQLLGSGADQSDVERLLHRGNLLLILGSFFGFGLALSLTPCVFPMIPILSGIIVRQGRAISRSRAALLSGIYVMGMAITYSLAGVGAGISGSMLSGALQNPWVLGAFSGMFVILALSMFGFFELRVPMWLQTRFSSAAGTQGGSMGGVAVMGALSALIVGPCIAPPLAGALLYIAKTGDAVMGGAALFVMALGMGVPLMLVGVFSREILPKAGRWMTVVTKGFGVLLLATSLWIVSPVLPAWGLMLCAALLLIVTAVFLHALDPLQPSASGWACLWKGVGVVFLVLGCGLLVGLLGGARDIFQPLAGLRSVSAAEKEGVRFSRVNSMQELDAGIKSSGRPVMLDFYADWCVSCKEMERETFEDAAVRKLMASFTLLQVDVTENTDEHKAILKRFSLFGPPAAVLLDSNGHEIGDRRAVGFVPAQKFRQILESAL